MKRLLNTYDVSKYLKSWMNNMRIVRIRYGRVTFDSTDKTR